MSAGQVHQPRPMTAFEPPAGGILFGAGQEQMIFNPLTGTLVKAKPTGFGETDTDTAAPGTAQGRSG